MENIEIKARYDDFARARSVVARLGGRLVQKVKQRDVYFHVPRGRMKWRTGETPGGELIFYERPDATRPRSSRYQIYLSSAPEQLEPMLRAALGVRVVVEKTREVYLIDNVRVHLDVVQGLGTFVEFEAVMSPERDAEAEREKLENWMQEFGIAPAQLVAQSYADLLEKRLKFHETKDS